ncbi:response regulator [Sinorhizobium fredii]|uniref:DNA-binding response regulator n=1 Tax=Rhizobium fredii TaxID=380 RepID=A0A2A6M6G5_RHIFR|nr:response regulator transcription factor [Sinorhizobium fredii]PDT50453.1 DNA-binding response regulator [Sinorhizobium fredii]
MDADNHQHPDTSVSVRVVFVDDHLIILDGLRRLIETEPGWQVVATCRSAQHAIEVVAGETVDLVVLDLRMPDMNGLDLMRRLRTDRPDLPLIILTADISDEHLAEAMQHRVNGIVLKEQAPGALVECIRAVTAGRTYFTDQTVKAALDRIHEGNVAHEQVLMKLTPREIQVSRLAAAGLRSRDIAARLGIAPGTVKLHLHSVYSKLNITTRVELANLLRKLQLASD